MKKSDISKKIIPLGDRVLIRIPDASERDTENKFGIIIPDTVSKERSEQGEVIAVGPGKYDEKGNIHPVAVKVGDTVVFSKYGYDEVSSAGEEFVMVKEENILAIIK